jgi:hypothetical protein
MGSIFRRLLAGLCAATITFGSGSVALAEPVALSGTPGYCPDGNGVTVVVDYHELGGGIEIRCAVGDQPTGLAALENAGFTVTGTVRWGKAFVCRINGKPTPATEPCVNTPPVSAYWSYWHASNGGTWTYSQLGATSYKPPRGSFEGWSFSLNHGPTDVPPPGVAPVRPVPLMAARKAAVSTPATPATAAVEAARWLAGELVDGALPGFAGPDWGLTLDALFALSATRADESATDTVATTLAANVRKYNSFDDFGIPGVRIAGATAKLLVSAVAAEKDPASFGGFNLRQETLDLVAGADAGEFAGRVRDQGTTDSSNTFGQSLAVIGLARTGGVPQPVVDFLIKQQCAPGGFRLSPDQFGTPAPSCDQATDPVLDPDSTAMAVQALLAADQAGAAGAKAAAGKGAAWLSQIQRTDGSFGGSGPTEASNANSTGLAAQALAAAGQGAPADKAGGYLLAHQLTSANASADLGAIAYNDAALQDATTGGIQDLQRDQWRRATAQAILGLALVPFGELPGSPTTIPPTTTTTSTTVTTVTTSTTTSTTTTSAAPAPQGAAAPGGLAATGVSVIGLLLLAGGLLGGGFGLRHAARRRPRTPA